MQLPFELPEGTLHGCLDLRAVYTRPEDGGVTIVIPTNHGRQKGWSDLDQCHYIASLDVPWGVPYHVMHKSELPQSRQFRDAWVMRSGRVIVDLDRARSLMRWRCEMLTRPRILPLWVAMDCERRRGTRYGDRQTSRLEAKLDQLQAASRETFEGMSLEELSAWYPSILRDPEVVTPQEQYEDRIILRAAPKEIELLREYRINDPQRAKKLEAEICQR